MEDTPLRALRKARGLSLEAVATACGLDKGNLSKLERGELGTSPDTAAKLVAYFGREFITELHILYPERYRGAKVA